MQDLTKAERPDVAARPCAAVSLAPSARDF